VCPFVPPSSTRVWEERAQRLRRQLRVALGLWPWPERTPLNAHVTGTLERDDYVVERVVLESLPGHFVTGNVFRPKHAAGHLPAVLAPHGHWPGGRFQDVDLAEAQRAVASGAEPFVTAARHPLQAGALHFARMGAVAFLFDLEGYADAVQVPIDVAHTFARERLEMHTRTGWGFYSPQAELHLQSVMGLTTWNALRALDYLASRSDVDPSRIGVAGASGGGTQTFILGALDTRPAALFPAVMVSTHMQGGCTCENASYLRIDTGNVEIAALSAPRPLGMTAADDWTHDVEHDGFPQLQRVYSMLGARDRVQLWPFLQFEHNFNGVSRRVIYEWFNRFLRIGGPDVPAERPFDPLTPAESSVWADSPGPSTVGVAHERALLAQLTDTSNRAFAALVPRDVESLAQFRDVVGGAFEVLFGEGMRSAEAGSFEPRHTQFISGATLETGVLHDESRGAALPLLRVSPHGAPRGIVIWLDPSGKRSLFDGSRLSDPVSRLVTHHYVVLGVDLFEQGEFRGNAGPLEHVRLASPRPHAGYTFGYNLPVPAERTRDVLSVVRFVRAQADGSVAIIARGPASAWAAGARAIAGAAVDRLAVDLDGFRFVAVDRIDHPDLLPGAAKYGDLPALLALSAPFRTWISERPDARDDLLLVRRSFEVSRAESALQISTMPTSLDEMVNWVMR
jgi:hypothetical protein